MGLLKGLFDLADDIVSIPTDIVGITRHHEKKELMQKATRLYLEGKLTDSEYRMCKRALGH